MMGSRLKEGDKSEKLIRALLKQPANSKCINCSSRGPQYVCTTFWTFICTDCSGIHREFTHRVKSVSMAKFTPEEISSLQAGGNERAKEIYFKEVDLHRMPDNRNVDRLRDFIKHVYVDKRYTGEKRTERPSITKIGNKEEAYDNKRKDSYQSGSRSPPYEDAYEKRHNSDRPSRGYEGRSPGLDQVNQRKIDNGRSPAPIGVINDWSRKDRFANGKRSEEDHRSIEGDHKVVAKSTDSKKDHNWSSSPAVRPITDILGENSISLQVIEPPRTSSGKMPDGSPQVTQQTASSNSLASSNGNTPEIKQEVSLIDFDAEFQQPVTAAVSEPQQSSDQTNAANSDNWSFLDSAMTNLSVPPAVHGLTVGAMLPPNGTTGPWATNGASSSQGLVTNPVTQVSQAAITPSQASSEVAVQPLEVQPNGRKQLPADLFTAMYAPQPVHASLWQAGLAPGMPFSAQYNTGVPMAAFPQSVKSANPFDLGSGSSPAQAPEFPPMTSLQNALPNMATPSWMPSQASPYPSGAPQLTPSYGASAMLPDTYKTQQLSSNMLSRPQGVNGFDNDMTGFSSTNAVVDLAARISAPAPSNPFG